jgi:hypothetical protein
MSFLRPTWKIVEWINGFDPVTGDVNTKFSIHYDYGLLHKSYGPFDTEQAAAKAMKTIRGKYDPGT